MSTTSARRAAMAVVLVAGVLVAGCGGDADKASTTAPKGSAPTANVTGSLSVMAVWTGDEQKAFQAVLHGFTDKYPGVKVKFTPEGDNLPTVLATAVQGGDPPDLALVAQPALVGQLQKQGALKPLVFAKSIIAANFPADIVKLGTIDGQLYSFVFKAANKSTVWFSTKAFQTAGVRPPSDWAGLLKVAATLKASGTPAFAVGGADGWTLTDLFENVYLRQAGPKKYDQLAAHEIKWTDPSVKTALRSMAEVLSPSANLVGGTSGALQSDLPTAVGKVLSADPKGAMVIEGDFVPGSVPADAKVAAGKDYDEFPFPAIGSGGSAVVGGGDSLVMFKDSPAGRALVEYLASPESAAIWAGRGGYSSANKKLAPGAYRDALARKTATAIAAAKTFRFDMSDLAPVAFGGTTGQGEFKLLQDFLANPSQVDQIASKLEAAAAKAYAK